MDSVNNGGCFVYTLCRLDDGTRIYPPNIAFMDEDQAFKVRDASLKEDGTVFEVRTLWVPHVDSYS